MASCGASLHTHCHYNRRMRKLAVLVIVAALAASAAAPPKKKQAAPDDVPHGVALYLAALSDHGTREVRYKARAHGTRFFFEEPGGVTVYRFEKGKYVRDDFLRDTTLERAVRRYAVR